MENIRNRIQEYRTVRAGDLRPDPRNWRRHPAAQRHALKAMLARIGWADALIARETPDGLMLIDGHLRADLDPDAMLPVLIVDLDDAEAGQLLATLDPLSAMAEAEAEALQALVASLPEIPPLDLNALYNFPPLVPEAPGDADAIPEIPEEPTSKRGDLYLLGNHRLMCGDSSDAGDVAALLDGATPRLMVTDPPYGVDYDPNWRAETINSAGSISRSGLVVNDDTTDWSGVFNGYSGIAVAYVWSPGGDHQIAFANILLAADFGIRNQIIWRKQKIVPSRGHYHWQHEPCWYAVKKGSTAHWIGDRKQASIWDISNLNRAIRDDTDPNARAEHSTQKPVECMERPIRNHEGDVYDPFVGSGTTIIAAERQQRTCYAMEIEPGYVDAAVKRWEQYTGRTAERL